MSPLLLIAFSALASAYIVPSSVILTTTALDNKCTFTLFHRQQQSTNYIQIRTIIDRANDMTINIASQRPATAFNSYTRLSKDHAFAVAGLLDVERLTITSNGDGVLRFEVGEVRWSSEEGGQAGGETDWAKCEAGRWVESRRSRERKLDCAYSCEKVADEDRESAFGRAQEDGQVRLELI